MFRPLTAISMAYLFLSATTLVACLEVPDSDVYMESDAGDGCLKCHHTSDEIDSCQDCHCNHNGNTAHQKHLDATLWGQPVPCTDCHAVPNGLFDGDHMNARVDVIFAEGSLARTGNLKPKWDGMRCSNVYCHGASLSGGSYTEPVWRGDKKAGILCGDCHGIPPKAPHVQQTDCVTCHPSAYNDAGALDFEVHLNGVVDF